jgi:hypothetical protein
VQLGGGCGRLLAQPGEQSADLLAGQRDQVLLVRPAAAGLRAVALLSRAVAVAREASLLPWRVHDAESTLRKAEAAAQGGR